MSSRGPEKKLEEKLRAHILKKYPCTYIEKNMGTGYTKKGRPDLEVKIPHIISTIYIETKKDNAFHTAHSAMSGKQKTMFEKIRRANGCALLLWDGGCAFLRGLGQRHVECNRDWVQYDDSKHPFEGFDTFIEEMAERGC